MVCKRAVLIVFCLLFAASAAAQERTREVLDSDWALGGRIVAIALPDQVQVYDMSDLDTPPLTIPTDNPRAVALSNDSSRRAGDDIHDVFRLAVGSPDGIVIVHPGTGDVLATVDQPATQLLWTANDHRLIAAYDNTITIIDTSWLDLVYNGVPYQIEYQFTLNPPLPDTYGTHYVWRIDHLFENEGRLIIAWQVQVETGSNFMPSYRGITTWSGSRADPPVHLPDHLWDVLEDAAQLQYSEARNRLLVDATWVDLNTGTVIMLPLAP